jgi:hypothetical protein
MSPAPQQVTDGMSISSISSLAAMARVEESSSFWDRLARQPG